MPTVLPCVVARASASASATMMRRFMGGLLDRDCSVACWPLAPRPRRTRGGWHAADRRCGPVVRGYACWRQDNKLLTDRQQDLGTAYGPATLEPPRARASGATRSSTPPGELIAECPPRPGLDRGRREARCRDRRCTLHVRGAEAHARGLFAPGPLARVGTSRWRRTRRPSGARRCTTATSAAGARLVPFAGWEMPVQYRPGSAPSTPPCASARASSTSATWARSRPAARAPRRCSSGCCPTTCRSSPRAARSTRVLCNEDGGVLDDLFTYRLGPDRFLTVTNARQPRARPAPGSSAHATGADAAVIDRLADFAMLAVQGPQARATRRRAGRRRAARALPHRRADGRRRARRARLRHRLHGRGRRRAAGRARRTRRRVWDAVVAGGAEPAGLGARDTLRTRGLLPPLRQRPVRGPRPDRGRPRLVLQGGDGLHRRRARRARAREQGTAEKLVPFAITGPGIARQGNPVVGGGVVTSGHAVADARLRHRPRLPAGRAHRAGHPVRDRRARQGPRTPKSAPSH